MNPEILVVGAGPAGSLAAAILAKTGHSVLLVDKDEFPRDKPCGDAVPAQAVKILHETGLDAVINDNTFYPIRNVRIVSPRGNCIDSDDPSASSGFYLLMVRRTELDLILRNYAVTAGARFLKAHVKRPVYKNGRIAGVQASVSGKDVAISCRALIGADGATSLFAGTASTAASSTRHSAIALRVYVHNFDSLPHTVEIHFRREGLPCYSWIFPLGDGSANIGVGLPLKKHTARKGLLKSMLRDFLEYPSIRDRIRQPHIIHKVRGAFLNYGSLNGIKRAFEGGVLIGDAGSLTSPLTGGGIHNALRSAQLAAKVIHNAFITGDFSYRRLRQYEIEVNKSCGRGFRWLHQVEKLISSELPAEILIKILGQGSLLRQLFVRLKQKWEVGEVGDGPRQIID